MHINQAFKFTHQGQVTFRVSPEGGVSSGIQKVKFEVEVCSYY